MLKIEYESKVDDTVGIPIVDLGVYRKGDDLYLLQRDDNDEGGDEFLLVPLNRAMRVGFIGGDDLWVDRDEIASIFRQEFEYLPDVKLVVR